MRVPQQAGRGYAKFTLALAGMKPGEAASSKIESLIMGDAIDTPAINHAYSKGNSVVRKEITKAIGRFFDASTTPLLVKALNDDDASVRRQAARSIMSVRQQTLDTVPELIKALKDEDEAVQWQAAHTLRLISAQDEKTPQPTSLQEKNNDLRSQAAEALRRYRAEGN